jgi:hypothetical protein
VKPSERRRVAEETLEALRRVDRRNHPTAEDIAHLHELHAQHERAAGRKARAAAAEERARLTRERDADQG